jgi:hypothetical protein
VAHRDFNIAANDLWREKAKLRSVSSSGTEVISCLFKSRFKRLFRTTGRKDCSDNAMRQSSTNAGDDVPFFGLPSALVD